MSTTVGACVRYGSFDRLAVDNQVLSTANRSAGVRHRLRCWRHACGGAQLADNHRWPAGRWGGYGLSLSTLLGFACPAEERRSCRPLDAQQAR